MNVVEYFEVEGVVVQALPNAMFKIKINGDKIIIAYVSGKMRKNYIRILLGDVVVVQMSSYDSLRGRIIFRKKEKEEFCL